MGATLRILLAGDIRLYRDGVAMHLVRDGRFELVGVADDPVALARLVRESSPRVAVVDIAMAGALDAVRTLTREYPELRVVALAVPELEEAVLACAEAGIAGYVMRDGSLEDLVEAIGRAERGELLVSPKVAASLLRHVRALAEHRADLPTCEALTIREREIVALIDEGLSNKEIAARLHIELATVKNHVHRILEKLHVARRGEVSSRVRQAAHRDVSGAAWTEAAAQVGPATDRGVRGAPR